MTVCPLCGQHVKEGFDPDSGEELWDDVIPFTPRAANPNNATFWIHWGHDCDWGTGIGAAYDDPNWVETLRNKSGKRCPSPDSIVLKMRQVRPTKVTQLRFYSKTNRED